MQPSDPNRPIELHHSPAAAVPLKQGTPRAAPRRTRSAITHSPTTPGPTLPPAPKPHKAPRPRSSLTQRIRSVQLHNNITSTVPIRWPGGPSEAATPDPIPNSAVKRLSAHGTASQDAGESVAARPPDGNPYTQLTLTDPIATTASHSPNAGWSSPVARQAHNLKVTGSNPVPASNPPPPTPCQYHNPTARSAAGG